MTLLLIAVACFCAASYAESVRYDSKDWVRYDSKNHETIVFVHGLMGDVRGTWISGNSTWPEKLKADPAFDGLNIYMYGYRSPKSETALTINQIEGNMWNQLVTDGVTKSDKLIFVSHSMGGILTRALILRNREYIGPKIRFLYFLATPTTGSSGANIAKLFSSNPQFGQLIPLDQGKNTLLDAQRDDWREVAREYNLRSFCAYEMKETNHLGMIVPEESATDLCTERAIAIEADHIGIVKPASSSDESYRALKAALMATASRVIAPTPHRKGPSPEETLGHLSALGWDIKRTGKLLQFDVTNSALPNMLKSAALFARVAQPFRIHLQMVPNIKGLELLAKNRECKEIEIDASDLENVENLSGFTELEALTLNQIPYQPKTNLDLSPLSSLTKLRRLFLPNSRVVDLSVVSKMPELTDLSINATPVRDIVAVKELHNLTNVVVSQSEITDLSPLAGSSNLQQLLISGNQIASLPSLAKLSHLTELNVFDHDGFDLALISALPYLEKLNVMGPPRVDFTFVGRLTHLKKLIVFGRFITGPPSETINPGAICSDPSLEELALSNVDLHSVVPLKGCTGLTVLVLSGLPITDISDIAAFQHLKSLSLSDMNLTDISALLGAPSLRNLSLLRIPASATTISKLQEHGVEVKLQ